MKWNRLLAGAVCASLLSVPVWAVEGGEAPAAGAGQTSSAACGVTLDGVCLDLSEAPAAPYQENGQVMLPLWKVAQALGWTVTWLPEENGTRIENEDQVMNLTYGLDRYACASKSSIGVTSPEHYGAAPVVVAGRTYVPASMFQLLSCTVTMEGGTVALRTEGAPPAEDEPPSGGAVEYQTAAEAEQAVGFPLKAPGELGAPEKIQVISGPDLQPHPEQGRGAGAGGSGLEGQRRPVRRRLWGSHHHRGLSPGRGGGLFWPRGTAGVRTARDGAHRHDHHQPQAGPAHL